MSRLHRDLSALVLAGTVYCGIASAQNFHEMTNVPLQLESSTCDVYRIADEHAMCETREANRARYNFQQDSAKYFGFAMLGLFAFGIGYRND